MTRRRTPSRSVLLAAAAASLAVVPATGASAASAKGSASVSRGVCATSVTDPAARTAAFTLRMADQRPAAASYGYSAQLQLQAPGGRWKTLRGDRAPEGLDGTLRLARSGAKRLVRKIAVNGLEPGYRYRLKARFRWTGAKARRRTVSSRSCVVRELRPNLAFGADPVTWSPAPMGDQVVYRVPVRLTGASALPGPRTLAAEVRQGDVVLGRQTFTTADRLDVVAITGRRCLTSAPIIVVLDADGALDERDESDDAVSTSCRPEAG